MPSARSTAFLLVLLLMTSCYREVDARLACHVACVSITVSGIMTFLPVMMEDEEIKLAYKNVYEASYTDARAKVAYKAMQQLFTPYGQLEAAGIVAAGSYPTFVAFNGEKMFDGPVEFPASLLLPAYTMYVIHETLVNLAGLLCSLALVPLVTDNQPLIWALFCLFTAGHLYANYFAVKAVRIETFNQVRLHFVAQRYFARPHDVMTVAEANYLEPVVWVPRRTVNIILGSSFSRLHLQKEEFLHLKKIYFDSNYLLYYNCKNSCADVMLLSDSSSLDQLQACFQAEVLSYVLQHSQPHNIKSVAHASFIPMIRQAQQGDWLALIDSSFRYTCQHFPQFLQSVRGRGWALHSVQLGADEWRVKWRETHTVTS